MKKTMCCLLLILLLVLSVLPASANSWGLSGDLCRAFSRDIRWDDYSTVVKQAGNFAVMGARYHNALMLVDEEGELQVYTKAVYQPEDKMDKKLSLTENKNGFTLQYGDESRFVFAWLDNEYKLIEADHGDIHMIRNWDYYYIVTWGEEKKILSWNITLPQFNIDLFPQTMKEIEATEWLEAALDSGRDILGWQSSADLYDDLGTGTTPVYSAPYDDAWRAAKGKAAVGLRGEVWVLREITNELGERYFCVRYDVSQRTQRVGYIKSTAVRDDLERYDFAEDIIHVPLVVAHETYLTDDPEVSQYPQFTLQSGTQLTCLGLYDDYYAYVAYENGDELVWGFVPRRDLQLKQDEYREIQHDVMAQLAGKWYYSAGGSMGPEYMELRADGTCISHSPQGDDEGVLIEEYTWYVTRYNPDWDLYWADVPYEMTFVLKNGNVSVKGLMLHENSFSLINVEGSGGYDRIETLPGEEEGVTLLYETNADKGNG